MFLVFSGTFIVTTISSSIFSISKSTSKVFCIDFEELVMTEENHKEILLQYYQKQFKITPKYLELGIEGPPHNRIFTMGVLDNSGDIISRGVAKSKKEAEQIASKKALEYFDQ